MALKQDGSVLAWGQYGFGQTSVPAELSDVSAIAAGTFHVLVLEQDGSVVAWGAGTTNSESFPDYGQSLVPPGLSWVTAIAAGGLHSVALLGNAPVIPSLHTQVSGRELILSWPTNAVAFTLQSAPSLAPDVTWTDSASVPAVVGARFTVTNTLAGETRFFRLRRP